MDSRRERGRGRKGLRSLEIVATYTCDTSRLLVEAPPLACRFGGQAARVRASR